MALGLYNGPNVSTGNGVATVYPYTFKIFAAADLKVTIDGVVQTLTTHYSVSGVGSSGGGNVTFVTAPANGVEVVIQRVKALTRSTDYQRNGSFDEETVDADFDSVMALLQQLNAVNKRAIKAPESVSADQVFESADWAASAGKFVRRNVAGTGYEHIAASPDDDTFTQSGIGAVARSWAAKVGEAISVKDFDAAGDGATDDLAAFTAALAAAAGKVLRVPAGNYRIPFTATSALTPGANTIIEGDGSGSTTITFVPSSTTHRIAFNNSAGGLELRDIKTVLEVPAGGSCSLFQHSSTGLHGRDAVFDGGCTNSGATISHDAYCVAFPLSGTASDANFINCDFTRFNYTTLKANESTLAAERISFAHCDFYGNYNEDLSLNSPNGTMDDVQVYMCRFRDGAGNSASLSQIYCAFASVTNFRVGGCSFVGDVGALGQAIHIEENCIGGSVTGNNINTTGYGVELNGNDRGGSVKQPSHITIIGNTFVKSGTAKASGSIGIGAVFNPDFDNPAKEIVIASNAISGYENGILLRNTLDDGSGVIGNNIENCTNGLNLLDGAVTISGNTTKNCTVGIIGATSSVADQSAATVADHVFINCTTNVDTTEIMVTLVNPTFIFTEFSHTANDTYKAILPAGANDRAYGDLIMTISNDDAAGENDRASAIYTISWDGTTFSGSNNVKFESVWALAADDNGGNIAVHCYNTANRTGVRLQAKLNGMAVIA